MTGLGLEDAGKSGGDQAGRRDSQWALDEGGRLSSEPASQACCGGGIALCQTGLGLAAGFRLGLALLAVLVTLVDVDAMGGAYTAAVIQVIL